ncbi:MAG TPA: adenylate/guanylate cyclase domain-containing protein [Dehalococcoidia bacterium]|nr:adenylate/guanylate cyclase domain-containing protein [Dehalococcoidia bacterium]
MVRLTVVFVDVRGFSALSEKTEPAIIVEKLNRFYRLAAQSVFTLDGTLDKMVSDGVMAFFGAPFQPEDHTTRTVQSALEIVSGTQPCPENIEGLPAGGGVATGEVFMGKRGRGGGPGFYSDWRYCEYISPAAIAGRPWRGTYIRRDFSGCVGGRR